MTIFVRTIKGFLTSRQAFNRSFHTDWSVCGDGDALNLSCDEIRLDVLMKCLEGRIERLPWAKQSGVVTEAKDRIATISRSGGRITDGSSQVDDIHSVFEAG